MLQDSAPADRAKRRASINDYLRNTLELFPDAMTDRRDIGDVSHTFSHIQMTLDVEMMSVKVSTRGSTLLQERPISRHNTPAIILL